MVFEHPACGERESRFSSAGKRSQKRIHHSVFAAQNLNDEERLKARKFHWREIFVDFWLDERGTRAAKTRLTRVGG